MLYGVLMAIEVVEPVLDALAEFKAVYLPVVWFLAWWLKNKTYIDNGTIPIFVLGMCALGQCLATLMAGETVSYMTVMAGLAWGVGAMGSHTGAKNVWDFVKRVKLGRG
jgi:hypothetical protein